MEEKNQTETESPPQGLDERVKRLEEDIDKLKKAITGLAVASESKPTKLESTLERLTLSLETISSKLDGWLEKMESAGPTPEFDPEELMKHRWKGKKKRYGEGYEEGSLAWGWDYSDNFSEEVRQILEKGPLHVDVYEFSLAREGRLVQTKKVERSER